MSIFLNYDTNRVSRMTTSKNYTSPDEYFAEYYPEIASSPNEIRKAFAYDGSPAAAVDTSLASTAHGNYRNYVYGKQMWAQMNIRPTAFTAIPRNQYIKSAFRIINEFASKAVIPNAVKEAQSHVPDIRVPKIESLRVEPRMIINDPYSMTLAQQALDGRDDTVNFDAILEVLQNEFSMRVNGQILMKNYHGGYGENLDDLVNYSYFLENEATLPDPVGVPLASIDNLISSKAEYDYLTGLTGADADQCAKAVDLFNMDRHTDASSLDSHVDLGNGTMRPLSVDVLDDAIQAIMPYWKDNTVEGKVMLTGFDTVGRLQQLHYQYQRFIGYTNYQVTYNGIKTCPGDVVGFGVSQFKGIPIVPDLMCTKEFTTNGADAKPTGLSRMYIMDTNTIHHAILIPPTFIQDKTYLARRALTDIATYYMSSQLVCTKPRANAKIMMLK